MSSKATNQLDPSFPVNGKVDRKEYTDMRKLLGAATGGRYRWSTATEERARRNRALAVHRNRRVAACHKPRSRRRLHLLARIFSMVAMSEVHAVCRSEEIRVAASVFLRRLFLIRQSFSRPRVSMCASCNRTRSSTAETGLHRSCGDQLCRRALRASRESL